MRGKFWRAKRALTRFVPKKYVVWEGASKTKALALTFDDGPHPEYTERILTLLNHYQIKATFFLSGENVARYPEITKRISQEGHLIGSHSFSHKNLKKISMKEFREDLNKSVKSLIKITGKNFRFLRPPYGKISIPSLLYCISQGITIVLWSLDSRDFENKGSQHILRNVISDGIKGGDVVLLHDDNQFTLEALPTIIPLLRDRGYYFVTINDFFNNSRG